MNGRLNRLIRAIEFDRGRLLAVAYGVVLTPVLGMFAVALPGSVARAPITIAVLVALAACDYLASEVHWSKVDVILDTGLPLALVAITVAGPSAALLVLLVPDAIRLARRGRAYLGLGLLANLGSYAAFVGVVAGALALVPAHAPLERGLVLAVGASVALLANYFVARGPVVVIRDRGSLRTAIRRELFAMLPIDAGMVVAGAGTCLLVGAVGPAALAVFAAFVYVPEAAVAVLLRAPSVAGLSIDAAAAVYRAAIADELGFGRSDRRRVDQIDALVQRRAHGGAPAQPLTIMPDAFEVSICTETRPRQSAFCASTRAQTVLVARRWAQLTARCTPALTHHEALRELCDGSLANDAPDAVAAVARIVERERRFSEHLAGVPRLHRAPLPRRARQQLLPRALARLTA